MPLDVVWGAARPHIVTADACACRRANRTPCLARASQFPRVCSPGLLARPGGFFANRNIDYGKAQELWDEGWLAADIATQLGCYVTTVYRALKG